MSRTCRPRAPEGEQPDADESLTGAIQSQPLLRRWAQRLNRPLVADMAMLNRCIGPRAPLYPVQRGRVDIYDGIYMLILLIICHLLTALTTAHLGWGCTSFAWMSRSINLDAIWSGIAVVRLDLPTDITLRSPSNPELASDKSE